MRKMEMRYKLEDSQIVVILNYLHGKMGITSRELGKKLGVSHQQALNLTTSVIKGWVMDGMIKTTEKFHKEYPNIKSEV